MQGPAHWSQLGIAPQQLRRQRLLQVARANRLLRLFRLQLHDFHGRSYLLSGPTGGSELVADFGVLWAAAERLLGRPIDPLALPCAAR